MLANVPLNVTKMIYTASSILSDSVQYYDIPTWYKSNDKNVNDWEVKYYLDILNEMKFLITGVVALFHSKETAWKLLASMRSLSSYVICSAPPNNNNDNNNNVVRFGKRHVAII